MNADSDSDLSFWRKKNIAELIEIYKAHPCLWKVSSPEYLNKAKRHVAYQEMANYCKQSGITPANREIVAKKIQTLRAAFRRELRKLMTLKKKPTLWYFDLLVFTKDQGTDGTNEAEAATIARYKRIKNEEAEIDRLDTDDCLPSYVYIEEENNEQSGSEESEPEPTPSRKRKQVHTSEEPVPIYETSSSKDLAEFEAVGTNIAKKLAKMDPLQAIYAESLINNVLTRGLLRKLSEDLSLCDNCRK